MRAIQSLWALALLPALAACGAVPIEGPYTGGYIPNTPPTGSGSATAQYNALYNETRDLRSRYAGAASTSAVLLPNSGQAVYEGTATIRVPTSDSLSLLGDATILADFSRDTVSGLLGNFTSTRQGQSQAQSWNGDLSISSAVNQGINVSRPYYVRGNVVGSLQSAGNRLSVDGIVDGNFHNNGYSAAEGLTASMQNGGRITYNGRDYTVGSMATTSPYDGSPAGLTIIAEQP